MDERHKVLIADSYPDEAEQLKKELSGKYNVISVRDNGVDTLDDIIKLKPDLVVIDLMLSEIDGIGVIEKCRELIEPDKMLRSASEVSPNSGDTHASFFAMRSVRM